MADAYFQIIAVLSEIPELIVLPNSATFKYMCAASTALNNVRLPVPPALIVSFAKFASIKLRSSLFPVS